MLAVSVACIALYLLYYASGILEIVIASFLWCVLPTPLLMFAIYARGDVQAAAIGALVPWVPLIIFRVPTALSFLAASVWLVVMSLVCGFVAGVTRRWILANLRN